MEISARQLKRVTVVDVDGHIDHSTYSKLEETLQGLIEGGTYNTVVDMDGVEYISSAGLRALLAARKAVRRFNRGDLRLANVHEPIRKGFDLVGFSQIFAIYDDLVQAVGSY